MKAVVGDWIGVSGRHVGDEDREGEVVEVLGAEGSPPYRVRWLDGHEDIFFPGSDAFVDHIGPQTSKSSTPSRK
jgi:Domain of unknown function (DUF1918)